MPAPTGHGVFLPGNLTGFGGASPTSLTTFDNLAAGATVTLGAFPSAAQPNFDVFAYIVTGQAAGTTVATLQPQILADLDTGTYRDYGAPYNIIESAVFQLPAPLTLSGIDVQWVLTALFATTTLELVITSR